MSQGSLPVDDSPPSQPLSQSDGLLHHQLEKALCRYFFEACDGTTQSRLMACRWTLCLQSGNLSLIIYCLEESKQQQVMSSLKTLAQGLKPFSNRAKICIFPPQDQSPRLEVQVEAILAS